MPQHVPSAGPLNHGHQARADQQDQYAGAMIAGIAPQSYPFKNQRGSQGLINRV